MKMTLTRQFRNKYGFLLSAAIIVGAIYAHRAFVVVPAKSPHEVYVNGHQNQEPKNNEIAEEYKQKVIRRTLKGVDNEGLGPAFEGEEEYIKRTYAARPSFELVDCLKRYASRHLSIYLIIVMIAMLLTLFAF